MDKKAWIVFSVVVIALFAGLIVSSNQNKVDVSSVDNTKISQPSADNGNIGEHVFGKADSPVVLIEYGDFQCPGCGTAHPTLKSLSEKYEGQIAFVFRNFPLTSIHPNALAAAASAEAAGLQNNYWPMHNMIYENQANWERLSASERTDTFASYAGKLGLDVAQFKTDVNLPKIPEKISFDQARAKQANVTGTPTIFLGGELISQDVWGSEAELDKAIQAQLKANNITFQK